MNRVENTLRLVFDGYWREVNKRWIPPFAGVYCVYACVYVEAEQKVWLRRLVSIEHSENIALAVANPENLLSWKAGLASNETLCYSFAPLTDANLRAKACAYLVREILPSQFDPASAEETVTVRVDGMVAFLDKVNVRLETRSGT